MPNRLYRWFMIGEDSTQLVIGSDHFTDFEANACGKIYRNGFWSISKIIDDYHDLSIRYLT